MIDRNAPFTEDLANAVMEKMTEMRTGSRRELCREIEHDLGMEVIGVKIGKYAEIIKKIPKTILSQDSTVFVVIHGKIRALELNEETFVPRAISNRTGKIATLNKGDPMVEKFDGLQAIVNLLHEVEHNIRSAIKAIYYQVEKVGELIDLWPESEEYLPETFPVKSIPETRQIDPKVTHELILAANNSLAKLEAA